MLSRTDELLNRTIKVHILHYHSSYFKLTSNPVKCNHTNPIVMVFLHEPTAYNRLFQGWCHICQYFRKLNYFLNKCVYSIIIVAVLKNLQYLIMSHILATYANRKLSACKDACIFIFRFCSLYLNLYHQFRGVFWYINLLHYSYRLILIDRQVYMV